MNYDKDSRPNGVDTITGEVLAEAMPWIKNITGKTIVIKYGGSAMVDEQLRAEVMADIVLLKIIGVNPVIVHGGGLAISEAMKRFDMPVKFIDGQRVTTDAAMKVVRSVLAGQVNQELVEAMNEHGRVAVGLSGADGATIIAEQASEHLGRVGRVVRINSAAFGRPCVGELYSRSRVGRHRGRVGQRLLQRERRRGGGPCGSGHWRAQGVLLDRRRRPLPRLRRQVDAHLAYLA